jgi:hypothetical protein
MRTGGRQGPIDKSIKGRMRSVHGRPRSERKRHAKAEGDAGVAGYAPAITCGNAATLRQAQGKSGHDSLSACHGVAGLPAKTGAKCGQRLSSHSPTALFRVNASAEMTAVPSFRVGREDRVAVVLLERPDRPIRQAAGLRIDRFTEPACICPRSTDRTTVTRTRSLPVA